MLVYKMEKKAGEIQVSFGISAQEKKGYNTILTRFDNHCVPKKNIVYETAKFFRCK